MYSSLVKQTLINYSPDFIDRPSLYGASPSNYLDNSLYYSHSVLNLMVTEGTQGNENKRKLKTT